MFLVDDWVIKFLVTLFIFFAGAAIGSVLEGFGYSRSETAMLGVLFLASIMLFFNLGRYFNKKNPN